MDEPEREQEVHHPTLPPKGNPLTRSALKELDRRNRTKSYCTQPERPQRRRTRLYIAEWKAKNPPADELIEQYSPRTLRLIEHCAGQGGFDLGDLRGFYALTDMPSPTMSLETNHRRRRANAPASYFSKTTKSRKTQQGQKSEKNTSPYSVKFLQHLTKFGIFHVGYQYPDGRRSPGPENRNEILRELAQPRNDLPDNFEIFQLEIFNTFREADLRVSVLPIMQGELGGVKTGTGEVKFNNLAPLTDGSLTHGNPDLYYGSRPDVVCDVVQDKLSDQIMPATQTDVPLAPNFFLELKGPDGKLAVAYRQACYSGALGARGIYSLQLYGRSVGQPSHDNRAYTITAIFQMGVLHLFTTHPIRSTNPKRQTDFATTHLLSICLINCREDFRKGVAAYRNALDWTKRQREEMIRQANHTAEQMMQIDTSESSVADEETPAELVGASNQKIFNLTAPEASGGGPSANSHGNPNKRPLSDIPEDGPAPGPERRAKKRKLPGHWDLRSRERS